MEDDDYIRELEEKRKEIISHKLLHFQTCARADLKEIVYGAKDIPFFYYFILPRLASFKLFFWMQNIYNFPGMENSIFDPEKIPENVLKASEKVWDSYIHVPSTEIWSDESINITLRQTRLNYLKITDRLFNMFKNNLPLAVSFYTAKAPGVMTLIINCIIMK